MVYVAGTVPVGHSETNVVVYTVVCVVSPPGGGEGAPVGGELPPFSHIGQYVTVTPFVMVTMLSMTDVGQVSYVTVVYDTGKEL